MCQIFKDFKVQSLLEMWNTRSPITLHKSSKYPYYTSITEIVCMWLIDWFSWKHEYIGYLQLRIWHIIVSRHIVVALNIWYISLYLYFLLFKKKKECYLIELTKTFLIDNTCGRMISNVNLTNYTRFG